MGLWGWWEPSEKDDPVGKLDPTLRDYLKKEKPKNEPPAPAPAPSRPKPPTQSSVPTPQSDSTDAPAPEPKKRGPPTLFEDGRYAHLWKNYKPQYEIEAMGKSDQERMDDIIEVFKERKANVQRAALENCALEQIALSDCYRNGDWSTRLTMCRTENKTFERCYMMQTKFLRALGYLSSFDRPPEIEEKIQMHADKLYHRMLDQEAAIEAAKKEGRPIPVFEHILSDKEVPKPEIDARNLSPEVQVQIKKQLEHLSRQERELEETVLKGEIQTMLKAGNKLEEVKRKNEEEAKRRREAGKETFADKVASMLGR